MKGREDIEGLDEGPMKTVGSAGMACVCNE